MLSDLDLRILRFVTEHGVLESERTIAKKLRLSPSTLSFKLRSFEDRGIITAYRYRIDFRKLGFPKVAWVFLAVENKKDVVRLMDEILSFARVHVCCFLSGPFQIAFKVYCEDGKKIEETLNEIKMHAKLENALFKVFEVNEVIKSHNLLMQKQNGFELTETDLLLLQEKMIDPSIRLNRVAKKIKTHKNTLLTHWKNLLENKIVLKKTPIINPDLHSELGINFSTICFFSASTGKKSVLEKNLLGLKEVHELNELSNETGFDFLAVVRTKNQFDFFKLLNSFYSGKAFSENLKKVEPNILLRTDSRRHTYIKDLKLVK